jgi:hypothetical protein
MLAVEIDPHLRAATSNASQSKLAAVLTAFCKADGDVRRAIADILLVGPQASISSVGSANNPIDLNGADDNNPPHPIDHCRPSKQISSES